MNIPPEPTNHLKAIAMPSLLSSALVLIGIYYGTFLIRLCRNYHSARLTGLPTIIIPWDQNHYVWMALAVPLRPHLKNLLPRALFNRLTLTIYGWEFHQHLLPYLHYAAPQGNDKTFFLLTCGQAEINTRDPELVWQILSRPRDFQQPALNAMFMAKFGGNVLTSNGDHWARQRRVIAGVINERISRRVWGESFRLAGGLVGEVAGEVAGVTEGLFGMMKKVTILVLAGAGMGERVEWEEGKGEGEGEVQGAGMAHRMSYMDACKTVIDAVAGPIILPRWFLANYPSFLPGQEFLSRLGVAIEEFPVHTREMLTKERQRATMEGGDAKSNIMSQLAQATAGDGKGKRAMSDDEMVGNLFVFTAAGFDTTANTLSYALVLCCRYPQWQEWMCKEIDTLMPAAEVENGEELDYAALFPKVVRVMAVMLETLRLFVPVIHLAKETRVKQTVTTSRGTMEIPAGCFTYVDAVALHLDPDVWRDLNRTDKDEHQPPSPSFHDPTGEQQDEYAFRPSRWINPAGSPQALFQPPRGSYVPWSAGPRVCPGQKMAQVEFTAIFLRLFRRHRIEAVPLEGESREGTEKRLDALMRDSVSILTLQMQGVYDVEAGKGTKLKLVKRR